ncbi:MAG: acetoin utilization protein acuB [Flavobacterium sp. BFFFF1]|uniref:CBS domain-containing protein n=1 Tax=unclassified Flavobacterium TaxID=196869 RepID=UPI000BCB59F9|nr:MULTISPECIES: CBS domain-containing protein [unclassified Flavobacterium]OYU79489.1 MAG: acetoin utilization protein acuB [Flavobacterium sp. BFFFF1]
MTDITDFINRDFKPIDSTDTIAEIQDFFAEVNFSHFPVLDEGVYIGSVSAEDAETFDVDKTLAQYRYAVEVFFARVTTNWFDVLELFARNHTDIVPVLDAENKYTGYYEISDIIKFFNDTPFLKDPGGIIIVEKAILDYSMGQVVQIVEGNNGKVLGVFVSGTTNDTIQITVKIAMGSINEIIQTFRRYDYEIVSEHNEDNYLANLKERSDYLDKYLNI